MNQTVSRSIASEFKGIDSSPTSLLQENTKSSWVAIGRRKLFCRWPKQPNPRPMRLLSGLSHNISWLGRPALFKKWHGRPVLFKVALASRPCDVKTGERPCHGRVLLSTRATCRATRCWLNVWEELPRESKLRVQDGGQVSQIAVPTEDRWWRGKRSPIVHADRYSHPCKT